MQTVRAADTNEVVKLIFRESDNDRKVMLQLEKKLFDYFNQDVFRDDNGTADPPGLGPCYPVPPPPAVTARGLLTSSHPGAVSMETLPGTWWWADNRPGQQLRGP
ncbi:hypothetical protein MC885_015538 [Smutsia gigantea]|nr:hypothetical protein MC885_015538 [Smutsia gigantea]